MIRSFIAFDIEDQTVLGNLAAVQKMLSETGANLKLVKPKNVHVTLRFLGNILPTQIDEIHRAMEETSFRPFEVEIKGVGVFPNPRRITVVWAGILRGADELTNIFSQLEPRLQGLGFRRDDRGFRPHLTFARVRSGRNKGDLVRRLEGLKDFRFGVIKAECLRLKKSVLTPSGPIYSILKETCPRLEKPNP